jgi:signal transduction histidine kinase
MAALTQSSTAKSSPAAEYPWRELALSMTCGILAAGTDGRLIFVNPPGRRILELPDGPVDGMPIAELLRDHAALRQVLAEAPGLHTLPNRAETEVRFTDGRRKTIGFTATVLRDGSGQPFGAAILFKDLTQIERTEEQERLRDRLAALGQMAAGMAHEIRNPLASIQVTTSLLRRNLNGNAETTLLVDKIQQEVQRLDRTLIDCLEFVKPLTPTLQPESVHDLVDEAIEYIRSEFPGARARFSSRIEADLPPLRMDRALLLQALNNLMRNSVEAMLGGGTVEIAATVETHGPIPAAADGGAPARMLRMSVRDDGPGIPPELHEKLFYPFFTTKKSGSGLGLPEVKKIVEIHGGLIDLDSEPDQGTAFLLLFPLTEDDHNPTSSSSAVIRAGGKRGQP